MNARPAVRLAPLLAAALFAACSGSGAGAGFQSATPAEPGASISGSAAAAPIRLAIEVHRSPTCSCCHEWEAYMRGGGWSIHSVEDPDMNGFKMRHGVPQDAWSCHTALVGGYVIEGHVPMEAIEDLLAQRPDIDGISLPAMPPGSPGMPGVKAGPFAILAIDGGRATGVFGTY